VPDELLYRLPNTVVPDRYDLTLAPDLGSASFEGSVDISVRVIEPVHDIVLNAADLQVHSATLRSGADQRPGRVSLDEATERLTIGFDAPVEAGDHVVSISFAGTLNDKLEGFYRSTYRDAEGTEHVIATTQFESTDARRAFPCWDEPAFKAVFAVTLEVDGDLAAISNGHVASDEALGTSKRRITFGDTMKMSTYLVAFIVGPLELTEAVDVDGTPLRVAFVPGKAHMTPFALEIGAHSLRFFTDYFGIPYPGTKLDMIALPDFAFGAMENLGAVTFRETALLVDESTASRLERERVADVVAHELAHMWFGDLVTMKWWNGIWLNEAFATFMELLAVDAFRPDWDRWVSFGASRAGAMVIDGMRSTRPIEFPVVAPEEAEGMFDVLTYQKGAAVVRMLEQYLGTEPFTAGIRHYIEKHSYANTETTDLWDAIEHASGEPVRSTMDSWIFQGGHPVLTVDLGDDGSSVRLEQQRFRYLPSEDDGEIRWEVPVLIRARVAGRVTTSKVLLTEASQELDLGGVAEWVVVNSGGSGFYRVRYSTDLVGRLTGDAFADLSPIERFNLVSDAWATVWSGLAPVEDFLALARLFAGETDPTVWSMVLAPFGLLERTLGPGNEAPLRAFVHGLVSPAFERLGWDPRPGEDEKTATLRGLLLGALGTTAGDEAVRTRAGELHAAYLLDRGAVSPDLVPAIVGIVAESGGEAEYQQFLDRFRSPATPQEEVRYLMSLAAFANVGLVRRTLDLVLSEVRSQNAAFLVNSLLGHVEHGAVAWDWVKEHWDELHERLPDNAHARMVESVSTLATPALADDVRAFLSAHPVKAGQKTVDQTLERLEVNVAFRQRNAAGLANALAG